MFSYQCSQLSTSESIIKVFDTAKSFQKKDTSTYVSVVVLDEVGLAEDSPNLPLKALHPLLEDGTAGADVTSESEQDQFTDEVVNCVHNTYYVLHFLSILRLLKEMRGWHLLEFLTGPWTLQK